MRTPIRNTPAVALGAIALLAAIVLAGCGSPGNAGPPTPTHTRSPATLWSEFASCARKHGVPNLPDPSVEPDGTAEFPGFEASSLSPSLQARILNACKSILDALPAQARGKIDGQGGRGSGPANPPNAAELRALKQFATCMRGHGLPDWPDPTADGEFRLDARLSAIVKPQLVQHIKACQPYVDKAGGHMAIRPQSAGAN